MSKVYGYCRISRKTQSLERQFTNILREYPDADIRQEAFTGAKLLGRKELDKLLRVVLPGDTIVFDSVSRMSRNAEEGIELYMKLYEEGVNLVFLHDHYADTDSYKKALESAVGMSAGMIQGDNAESTLVNDIMTAIVKFMKVKASDDIRKGFEQAEAELKDNHYRTSEGIREKKAYNEKVRKGEIKGELIQIGRAKGKTPELKKDGTESKTFQKAQAIKGEIKKKAQDFGGAYLDTDLIKVLGISRATYYKYKKELTEELNA